MEFYDVKQSRNAELGGGFKIFCYYISITMTANNVTVVIDR